MNIDSAYSKFLLTHVNETEKDSDAANISRSAIRSFENIMAMQKLMEEDLSSIVLAAKSRHLGPYYIGTELLLTLQTKFPSIKEIWHTLSKSNLAHERWVAISVIRDGRIPNDLAEELVQQAINDKSSKVRSFAVEGVLVRDIQSLLPELKQRLKLERDKKVVDRIDWVLSIMEQEQSN